MAVAQALLRGIGKYLLAMPVPLSHCKNSGNAEFYSDLQEPTSKTVLSVSTYPGSRM